MSRIHGVLEHRFEHDGQAYLVAAVATPEGWALITFKVSAAGAPKEAGYRDYLPASALRQELQLRAAKLQQRVEAGDEPDEDPGHGR